MFALQIESGTASRETDRYLVEKYRHLALTEKKDVRSFACWHLWIIANDRNDQAARQAAAAAMLAANCRCQKTFDHIIKCE